MVIKKGTKLKKTYLPEEEDIQRYLELMLESLQKNGLETKLVEAPEKMHHSHCIRFNENENPKWYKELCDSYLVQRKKPRKRNSKYSDTRIRRNDLVNTLNKLLTKGFTRGIYAEDLIKQARMFKEGEELAEEAHKQGDRDYCERIFTEYGLDELYI